MSGGMGGGDGGGEGPSKDRRAEITGAGQDNRPSAGGGNTSPRPPLDGAFLLQLLRKPPQARPPPPVAPLPHELHQPRRDPVVPSFPFPPHKVIAPPPPAAVAADHSPPSPVKADSSAEPGIIRPVADHRRLPEDSGRPERKGLLASRKAGYLPTGRYSGSGRRGSGFQKAMAGGGGGDQFGGWTPSRRNGDTGYAQSGRRGKVHMARPHGSIQRSQSHNEKGKVEMVEQRRPPAVAQRRKTKEEWIPVNGRQDGKIPSKTTDDSKKEGNESSNSGVQSDDQIELLTSSLTAGKNGLSEEESAFDDLACEVLEEGYSSEERVAEDDVVDDSLVEEHVPANESMNSVVAMDDPAHRTATKKSKTSRFKELRSDLRGQHVSSLRMRIHQRHRECRDDIETLSPCFLFVYESLIPSEAEKAKQNKLLQSLQKSVNKAWPNAQLHLYGSCANTFGLSNSDIDICLAIDDGNMTRNEMLLKLAEILELDNLQNVQALTSARVPIVKMMDPETGISCDICINNLLAMVNTKLLKDYAQIDDRLHQLAFIVKHWARSRAVNETYRGTLSSYAYVLMCIHFLQLCKPAILPCLQEMESTYSVTVDDTECAYFDQVEKLKNFGAQNKESIAQLIWAFFHYWAYHHDYINDVVSVRTGSIISKQSKDWTKRIGNDRHLICIEDPFETSHDLGRVVDKHSIKILREEFERAADILQYNPDPSVTLFEPYIPSPTRN